MPESKITIPWFAASLFAVGLLCDSALPSTVDAAGSLTLARAQNSERDYVALHQVATSLGLRETPGKDAHEVALTGSTSKLELRADSREALVDGLRVFLGTPVIWRDGLLCLARIDLDRVVKPLLRPDLCRPPAPVPQLIVLDPGHGGIDHGAENKPRGLEEKDCSLDVALRLKILLETAGWRVGLTRDRDIKIDLADRAAMANRLHADVFVSIHFNSLSGDTKTSGTETFTFTPRFQRSSRSWSLGETDDAEDEAAPVNRFDQWSIILAHSLQTELLGRLGTFDRGMKTAHFGMLRGLNCPGVLIESGFLSNEPEAAKIATEVFRQQIAEAMFAGIQAYGRTLGTLNPKATSQQTKP